MEELVESSEEGAKMMAGYHGDKKTGYKISRKSEKDMCKDDTDLKKVTVDVKTKIFYLYLALLIQSE